MPWISGKRGRRELRGYCLARARGGGEGEALRKILRKTTLEAHYNRRSKHGTIKV